MSVKENVVLRAPACFQADESHAGRKISTESAYTSCSPSKIPMMQSANQRFCTDRSELGQLDRAGFRVILDAEMKVRRRMNIMKSTI